jgi:ABC-type molybdate transport system substrate-binding protein
VSGSFYEPNQDPDGKYARLATTKTEYYKNLADKVLAESEKIGKESAVLKIRKGAEAAKAKADVARALADVAKAAADTEAASARARADVARAAADTEAASARARADVARAAADAAKAAADLAADAVAVKRQLFDTCMDFVKTYDGAATKEEILELFPTYADVIDMVLRLQHTSSA